ncbi:hypothetical protein HPB49_004754 [Dermacentor silvarum]|uniref:Uncharacterized protein n=1 Tax=Dermacentor silvarum TaxID=543639 RepID=A0ACB8DV09_DERSI|nr:hypothetical protein HPB49_004754 [Dermacentor silvarum]
MLARPPVNLGRVDRKEVRQWNSTYKTLLHQYHRKGKFRCSMNNGRPVSSEEVDDGLLQFLEEERAAGKAVSNHLLEEKELKLASGSEVGILERLSPCACRGGRSGLTSLPARLRVTAKSFLSIMSRRYRVFEGVCGRSASSTTTVTIPSRT